MLRPSDAGSRQRLRNEFNVCLTLEKAYHSGELRDRNAPRCYGAFKGNRVDVLILDLCEDIGESSALLSGKHCRPCSESDFTLNGTLSRPEVYKLVQDLHRFGILHGDLEPRNIACARGGE